MPIVDAEFFSPGGFRLPTETQWEYAARGGLSANRFPWDNTITHSQANYYSSSSYSYDISYTRGYHPTWNDGIEPFTSQVGSFPANGYGLYDMSGNVWEWCYDWWGYYSSVAQTNPTGPTTGKYGVVRGGSWDASRGSYRCRVSSRHDATLYDRYGSHGFRVVLDF